MGLTEKSGFFPDYYLNLKNSNLSSFDKEIEKIAECHNDVERMAFVDQLTFVKERDDDLRVRREYNGKDSAIAADLKEKGNSAFKAKKWLEAMMLYTKSYVAVPQEKAVDKAIALANRSATLYHMKKYDESLIDIKRSMELGYPKDLLYKLYERQARCYMAKMNYPCTIAAFKKCITAIDDSNLPSDKRGKMNLDAMTMIKMLERDNRTAKQAEKQKKMGEVKLSLALPAEKEFISSTVRFDQNREEGRFARANADIKVGEEILVEKPFVAVLLEKYAKTHCENCFSRTAIPVACSKCADVIYCSEECQTHASKTYHKYECGILPLIWRSGASINCHMALRIFASKSVDYFLKIKDDVNKQFTIQEIQKLPKDDFHRISHLVRHEDTRTSSNFFQHALMARFLTKCLQESGYFGEKASQRNILDISGLLLYTLQLLQYNTHEVAELHKYQSDGNEKTIFIGGALYPNLALFNHSCDPGIVRFFRGNTIHVNTIRPIEAGLPISENYGPMYTQESREERQSKLKDLYCFDCSCDACLENWPTFENLPTDVIRFRCDAPNTCTSIIEVPATCNDFMVKCVTCGECTNIFKGLKVMQDTEMMTRTAKRLYDTGEYSKALNKYIDLLKIMYEVLAPPFPDFCQCQQSLKDCFLHFGNFYNLD
ncbi:SET and MYND domain-containing protein 4-like [Teleopsis dalmanni]|uniref:SET and MYND domain-containing protein 4-like n=1 Tax=Teleopsis dalmanni TaxID=139649 RepID=UPI000D32BCA4|nr:SET and MYND domain-containing protein 4-like [Teleopsis dalmanni]